jgi:hypothetical protein
MIREFPRFSSRTLNLAAAVIGCGVTLVAQQPSMPGAAAQREAMKKLAFLAGTWSGPVSISRGPGEPLKLMQTENVQFKLDGLVLLIEGQSVGADGKPQFQALATVSYDDAAHAYRFRAYNDGHYVDTELTVNSDGFAWGFNAGPAKIQNTMHLTTKGEWQETTDVTFGSNPPRRSVDMLLQHQP